MSGWRLKAEKICPSCEKPFRPWQSTQRCCSRKCADEDRRARGVERSSETRALSRNAKLGRANPNFKHGRRAGDRDRSGEARWHAGEPRECENPACRGGYQRVSAHHCVYRQAIARANGDKWDPRNRLMLCNSCHSSHHARGRVVPLAVLPASVFEYAVETLGAGPAYEYLRRRYAGEDPRLEALLALEAPS